MNTVQRAAAPANPLAATTAAASAATDAADAAAGTTALPWIAALQDALAHLKGVPTDAPATTAKNKAVPLDASAADGTDKKSAPDASAENPAVNPLALLATLPPQPAQSPTVKAAGDGAHEAADTLAFDGKKSPALPDVKVDSKAEAAPAPAHATPVDAKELEFAAAVGKAVNMNEQAAQHESRMLDSVASTLAQSTAQAPAPALQPNASPVQSQLNATVATPAWNTELGHKVVWMVGAKEHVAELRLNPPELGPLDIKLTVSGNETTAVFTSPHGAVRDAVESALPRLREVLAESGVMLGNASVTSDTPRDGGAFANQENAASGRSSFGSAQSDATTVAGPTSAPVVVRPRGLVDLFA